MNFTPGSRKQPSSQKYINGINNYYFIIMKKVAILGGTGNIGEGLARRICLGEKFDVEIGSRGAEKAAEAAVAAQSGADSEQ